MKEPLYELFKLFEQEMIPKQDPNPTVGGPAEVPAQEPQEHPVVARKKSIDAEVQAGNDPVTAYQKVFGEVDPGNTESKAELARTLGRYSKDKTGNVQPEEGSTSIFALDAAMNEFQADHETDEEETEDMKTPAEYEDKGVDMEEEYDYNEDVAYLQTYGRA